MYEFLQPIPREPAVTGVGSSDGPMQQKRRESIIPMRLFDTPDVGLESIHEDTDFEPHDMPDQDDADTRNPHDNGYDRTIDCDDTFPGVARVKST